MNAISLSHKTILVTGVAGFIGSNLVKRIYQEEPTVIVIGIDNMNAYYDVALKEFRLKELSKYPTFTFIKGNIADKALITDLFDKYKPSVVVNLAAQAGVRYSITNPDAYVESNLVGFFNILEACRHSYDDGQEGVEHLVYGKNLITSYEEKPKEPKGNLAVPPFYCYRACDVKRIQEAMDNGCGYDAPGSFAAWLSQQTPMHAYLMPGKRYDIGDLNSYEYVKSVFSK